MKSLTVIIAVALMMLAALFLPGVLNLLPTSTSTSTGTKTESTTFTATNTTTSTINVPLTYLGPTLANQTDLLRLEISLSNPSVKVDDYLVIKFNLTGRKVANASYVQLTVFDSDNQQVWQLSSQIRHPSCSCQNQTQFDGSLYWQAKTNPSSNVNILPGNYTLLIEVSDEDLSIETSISVI